MIISVLLVIGSEKLSPNPPSIDEESGPETRSPSSPLNLESSDEDNEPEYSHSEVSSDTEAEEYEMEPEAMEPEAIKLVDTIKK